MRSKTKYCGDVFESDDGTTSRLQLIVPREIRKEILHELHAGAVGGHLGEEKTLGCLKERFYWPGHFTDVRNWCKTCAACATRKTLPTRGRAPLKNIQVGYPMQVVAVDILGPLPESNSGNAYLLVASDYFTRWVEIYAIPNQEALTVAKKLVDEFFCRFSAPEQLHSDQGRQFESDLIKHICDLLQIKKTRTTPYHPQCDGLVERFNRTLLDMLATTTKDNPFNWEDHVRKVSLAYNSSIHPTTGYTPFYLMFGRQARLPVDLMFTTDKPKKVTPTEYATQLRDSLEQAFENVQATMGSKLETQKQIYDHKVHGDPFSPGTLVWLHSPVVPRGGSRKLHHPWTGPWKILKRISDATYRIQDEKVKQKRIVVHFNRLKQVALGTRIQDPDTQTQLNSDQTTSQVCEPTLPYQVVDDDNYRNPLIPQQPVAPRYPVRIRQPPHYLV